jgi:ubiquitin-like 1-activating enzyme E1 B
MDQANILVVGAGGIGCELIKTLVLSGAKRLTVIDLDQIDKSNLNRQFLFTKKDVGRSKALVAAEVISSLRPSVQIKGLYENVFNLKHDFFEEFNLVFNALDNLAARRYVNRICVFLGKAFIDAGTRGKNGQVTVHVPHVSMCYDCRPKATPKQYAVCTIRSTPSIIEHCIAWGKYLYEALFGPEDNSNILSELASARTCTTEELFDLLFKQGLPAQATALEYPTEVVGQLYSDMFATLNFKQLVNTLDFSFTSLKSRPSLHFDKNDKLSVHFITSVSNLRCLNFGIQCKCLSSVQEIAGNIIPAIGSTNAIVAGLQVIEGLKILSGKNNFGAVWVQQSSSNNKFIFPSQPEEPDKNVGFI